MERNLQKEYKWSKEKYETIFARIDKKIGLQLKDKLNSERKSTAEWIIENAKEYLKEN